MAKTKLKMDAATRKKLMGYSVVSESLDYTPTIEGIDEEFLPTFKIKSMSLKDQRELKFMFLDSMQNSKISNKEKVKRDDFLTRVTMESIVGFENVLDISKDEIVEWKSEDGKDHIDKLLFESLPTLLKTLVMNEVLKINGLSS